MKPVSTVQLPIAKFRDIIRDFDRDNDGLAEWVRSFSKALICDKNLNDFAYELLEEVESYKAKNTARVAKFREKRKSLPQPSSYEEERLDDDSPVARTAECKKRQSGDTTKAPPTYSALPSHSIPSLEEVYDYARSQELDDILTREWYEMTSERQWCDRNGEVIKNWKIALKSYVKRRISNIIKEETTL